MPETASKGKLRASLQVFGTRQSTNTRKRHQTDRRHAHIKRFYLGKCQKLANSDEIPTDWAENP
ncbi:MAG: hypothetical protein ABF489_01660 [Bifidobacterium sp.]|uniref:hypothetical protein n=1 Tax=Bifidobacterium sp. TaxID=41200 RepID=UPI0039E87ECA